MSDRVDRVEDRVIWSPFETRRRRRGLTRTPRGVLGESSACYTDRGGAEYPVDETDIQRLADLVLGDEEIGPVPPEDRARLGYDMALAQGTHAGLSDVGAQELAVRVKRRIEWALFARRNDSDGHT